MKYVDLGLPSGTLWADCNHNGHWNYNDSLMVGTVPTIEQWDELMNCCSWTWTKQNGIFGYKVTSKKNGASIFLPAAGYRSDTGLGGIGSCGGYWSSSPDTSYPDYACYVFFNLYDVYRSYRRCYNGQSIRLVKNI